MKPQHEPPSRENREWKNEHPALANFRLMGYRKEPKIFILAPSTGFVALGKFLNVSECWFLHL